MFELAVATSLGDLTPAVLLQQAQNLGDLHERRIPRLRVDGRGSASELPWKGCCVPPNVKGNRLPERAARKESGSAAEGQSG
jgi:hypothetical protein